MFIKYFPQVMLLRYNVKKYIGAKRATARHMPLACRITTGTDTHTHTHRDYANVPQYFVIRTLVLLCYGKYSIVFLNQFLSTVYLLL
jgi:hypothetical protein